MPACETIRGCTILAGTVGDPVAHVQAPETMGHWFATQSVDAVWLPFHVHPEALPAFVDGARALVNLAGFTVTMPHKRAIVALVDGVSVRVRRSGVANLVRREADGRLIADLADGIGFVAGLESSRVAIAGRTIWLVGAGGAGTAIAWALAEEKPAKLAITDVDAAAAARLVDDLRTAYPGIAFADRAPAPSDIDIAVNATPCGLHAGDPLPFDPARLRADACVAEIIMNPAVTDLLRTAAALGLKTVPGQRMLDGQLRIYADYLGLAPAKAGPIQADGVGG